METKNPFDKTYKQSQYGCEYCELKDSKISKLKKENEELKQQLECANANTDLQNERFSIEREEYDKQLSSIKHFDEKEVEEIITDSEMWKQACEYSGHDDYRNMDLSKSLKEMIDQICNLSAGEVIAEGGGSEFWKKIFIDYNDDSSKFFKSVQGKEVSIKIL